MNKRIKHRNAQVDVVTSPASSNGNVTYKEITTNHKFKKKKCDLHILAKKGKQEVSLSEGDVLEIDSNGDIVEQKKRKEKEVEKYVPPKVEFQIVNVPTPDGKRIKAYEDRQKQTQYRDNHSTSEMESYPIFENIPNMPQEKSPIALFFKTITNLSDITPPISLYPQGSSKCDTTKTVNIYPVAPIEMEGKISLTYAPSHIVYQNKNGPKRDYITDDILTIDGSLAVKQNDISYEYGGTLYSKGSEDLKKVRRKHAKDLFSRLHYPLETIFKYLSRYNPSEKQGAVKMSAGKTKIEVSATKMQFVESQKDYGLDWKGELALEVTLFDGANITVDIIEFIVAKKNDDIAELVRKVRKDLEDGKYGVTAVLEVNLTVDGKLNGKVTLKKEPDKDIVTEGEIGGFVGITLSSKVEGEIPIWFETRVKAGVELKNTSEKDSNTSTGIGGKLTYSEESTNNLGIGGDIYFSGLAIYWAAYAEVVTEKVKQTDTESKPVTNDESSLPPPKTRTVKTPKGQAEGTTVIFKELSLIDEIFGIKNDDKKSEEKK